MKIRYLYHDGFAVELDGHCLIFDYYKNEPKGGRFAHGYVNPDELLQFQKVTVFASHKHQDHFNPCIFGWRRTMSHINYVLSSDIRTDKEASFISPGQTIEVDGLRVSALESTDEGVAFLVKSDDTCIYHAGDLNWWHWEGELDCANREMARRYKEQIDQLRGEKIDVAFVPVDSRLEGAYLLGMDYFMRNVGARIAVPMHFWDDYSVCARMKADERTAPYRDRLLCYKRRGEVLYAAD